MEGWKKMVRKLLWPGRVLTVLIPAVSFGILIAVFYYGVPASPLVYGTYVLAFYGLVVLVLGCVPLIRRCGELYRRIKASRMFQAGPRLVMSMAVNVCYGGYNLACGILYQSRWLLSTGVYYLVLSLIRLVLVGYEWKRKRTAGEREQLALGWRGFQVCGMLMLVLNLAMSGMVAQMIWEGKGSRYPEMMVYAVAAYTFYRLASAIIRVARYGKNASPIHGAARNISLTAAVMSLYSLQTAMLSVFGNDPDYQLLMNSLSGGAVCLLTVLGALGMAVHGGRQRKETLLM